MGKNANIFKYCIFPVNNKIFVRYTYFSFYSFHDHIDPLGFVSGGGIYRNVAISAWRLRGKTFPKSFRRQRDSNVFVDLESILFQINRKMFNLQIRLSIKLYYNSSNAAALPRRIGGGRVTIRSLMITTEIETAPHNPLHCCVENTQNNNMHNDTVWKIAFIVSGKQETDTGKHSRWYS